MKNITKLFMTLLIFTLVLVGCGSADDNKTNDTVSENSESDVESDTEDSSDQNAAVEDEKELFELFSQNGLTISTDKVFTEDEMGLRFSIWVDNATEQNLIVSAEAVSLNLYMVDVESFFAQSDAGTKTKIDALITKSSLERSEIEEIGQLDIWFKIYDSVTYDDFYQFDKISIETDAAEGIDIPKLDYGTQIYNNNDIRVVANKIVKTEDSAYLEIFIENNTNDYIAVTTKNVKANGTEAEVLLYGDVRPLRMSVDDMQFFNYNLINDGSNEITFDLNIVVKDPVMGASMLDNIPVTITME